MLTLFFLASCQETFSDNKTTGTIYVSSSLGDDANDGYSPQTPWKTMDKVNSTQLKPGQKLLFKAGDVWEGQLRIQDKGTPDSIITIGRYGVGTKPKIEGLGLSRATLLLKNSEYVHVKNLEITNEGTKREPKRVGVLVQAIDAGELHNITLDSLEVHHVNGSLVKKKGGGSAIFWENRGDSIKSRFIDLKIQNCHLHHTGRNGITSSGYSSRDDWYPSLGVKIQNNLLEQIPGDGIVPIGTDGTLIEYNIMRDSPDVLSHQEAAAGIWPWSSDNTVIQFNEVSGHKAKWDGQGFDSDYNCKNTLIQYNYSHDNFGGFILVCNNGNSNGDGWSQGTTNSIIRYNISVNDGLRPYPTEREGWFSPTLHITGPVENTLVNNNIIVQLPKPNAAMDLAAIKMDTWGGWPIKTTIKRNYFIAEYQPFFVWGKDSLTVFEDNKILVKEELAGKSVLDYLRMVKDKHEEDFNWDTLYHFLKERKDTLETNH